VMPGQMKDVCQIVLELPQDGNAEEEMTLQNQYVCLNVGMESFWGMRLVMMARLGRCLGVVQLALKYFQVGIVQQEMPLPLQFVLQFVEIKSLFLEKFVILLQVQDAQKIVRLFLTDLIA